MPQTNNPSPLSFSQWLKNIDVDAVWTYNNLDGRQKTMIRCIYALEPLGDDIES